MVAPVTALRGKSVLILEDHALIAMDAEQMITELGATAVALAGDVDQAMRLLDERHFDFAVLDVYVGEKDCFGVAETLERRNIDFVFATGVPSSVVPLPEGMTPRPWLLKPYDADSLLKVLNGETMTGSSSHIAS